MQQGADTHTEAHTDTHLHVTVYILITDTMTDTVKSGGGRGPGGSDQLSKASEWHKETYTNRFV